MGFGEATVATVAAVLAGRRTQVYAVSAAVSVEYAVCEMNLHHIGSLLVKKGIRAVGIFTERDVLTRVVCAHRDPQTTRVSEVMTRGFISIGADTPVEVALEIMIRRHVRHLPVRRNGKIIGIVSAGDISGWLIRVHKYEAENLLEYILTNYPH
jgi:CBS domain-containing protein